MGIFIHQDISTSVTAAEWEKVYEETLVLVNAFPLAERSYIPYAGKKVICAVPSKEREMNRYGHKETGWCADMDYDSLNGAEEYFLPRNLVNEKLADPDAGDAMMGALPSYIDCSWNDKRCTHTYSIWGNKTQGEPYHMYLLAIACLIEARLGEKAFVYGDITLGQCRAAVEMANAHLAEPIRIPARCEMERLYERVNKLPLKETEKLKAFEQFYLGAKDGDFYQFVKNHFCTSVIAEHWRDAFSDCKIGTIGFHCMLKSYLTAGLSLEELCGIVNFDGSEPPKYEKFIKAVMDSKLHIKEKDTSDRLDINPETEQPYSIWTLMAQFSFASAHNPKVDRFIPIEEIKAALKKGMGDKCDVVRYIDKYLEQEAAAPEIDVVKEGLTKDELMKMADADAAEVFRQITDQRMTDLQEQRDNYDIADYEDLANYRSGDSIEPRLEQALLKSYRFYHSATEEETYKKLMKETAKERSKFLIEQNRYIMLRDRDWEHIFSEIERTPESYNRYYPMVRVKCNSNGLIQIVRAFVLNDDFYAFVKESNLKYEG